MMVITLVLKLFQPWPSGALSGGSCVPFAGPVLLIFEHFPAFWHYKVV